MTHARRLRTAALLVLLLTAPAALAGSGWILTSDYSTFGDVRHFAGGPPWTVSGDLGAIPGDAVGRLHGGYVYVVGRGTSNLLQVWDPDAGFELVDEFGLGSGLNLQDVAFDAQGEAYLSCLDSAELLRVDPVDGTILGSYDTSAFADADGLPETGWMVAAGDRLYIACQRLDAANWYLPTGPGAILVFDTAAEAWVDMDPFAAGVQPIELVGENPYTRLLLDGDRLTVGCAGAFGLADGGIETVDLGTGASTGFVATETQLGGDVNRIQRDGETLWAIVNDAAFNTFVVRHQGGTADVLTTGSGFVHADILLADGALHLLDRTAGAAGLRVFDPTSGAELTAGPVPTGLAPALFVTPGRAAVSSVPPPASAPRLALAPPFPNPFNPATTLPLRGPADADVQLVVHDLRGRRLRVARVRTGADGTARWRFDGRDGAGRRLAAGVYLVSARLGAARVSRRVALVK